MYDMKHMQRLRRMQDLAPEQWKAFAAFNEASVKDGALPHKTKELIAVAVALTTQCAYCIEVHLKAAKKAGVTEKELAETAIVAAALRAGGAIAHASHILADA